MKIISLKFKNIHSLKGEHFIDFTESPLSDTGLFAITGPTGAGKSSILDAMTVALYGKVPRINNESSREVPTGIMTRGTTDCFAETVFQIENKRYLSRWSARVPRKNIKHSMDITDLSTDEILDSTLKGVPLKVEELSGLNYERFLRSVFLSQGEFASFLKAKESERGDLLEQITGTEIYSQISKAAHQRERLEKAKLDTLQEKQGFIELLSEEDLENFKAEIQTLQNEIKLKTQEQSSIQTKLQWLKNIETMQQQLTENSLKLQNIIAEKQALRPLEDKLQIHEKAAKLAPDLKQYEILKKSLKDLAGELAKLKTELELGTKDQTLQTEFTQKSKLQLDELKLSLTKQEPLIQTIIRMDEKIAETINAKSNLKIEFGTSQKDAENANNAWNESVADKQKFSAKLVEHEEWLKINSARVQLEQALPYFKIHLEKKSILTKDIQENLDSSISAKKQFQNLGIELNQLSKDNLEKKQLLEKETEILKSWENSRKIKCGLVSLAELEAQNQKADGMVESYKELVRLSREFTTRSKQNSDFDSDLVKLQNDLTEFKDKLLVLKNDTDITSKNLEQLTQICRLQTKIIDLESERIKLEMGKPCPLCGSKDHPFVAGNYEPELSQNEIKRDEATLALKELNEQTTKLRELMSSREALLKAKTESRQKLIDEMKTLNLEFKDKANHQDDISQTAKLVEMLNSFIKIKQDTSTQISEIRKIDDTISRYKTEIELLREADHKYELNHTTLSGELKNLATKLEEFTKNEAEFKQKLEIEERELEKLLQEFKLAKPALSESEIFLQNLKKSTIEYRIYETNRNRVKDELAKLTVKETQLSEQAKNLAEISSKLEIQFNTVSSELQKLQLEREKQFGQKDPQAELQKLKSRIESTGNSYQMSLEKQNEISTKITRVSSILEQKQIEQKRQNESFEKLKIELKQSSKNLGFEEISELQHAILAEDNLAIIKQRLTNCDDLLKNLEGAAQSISSNLETEQKKELTTKTGEELNSENEVVRNILKELQEKSANSKALLSQNDERKKQMGSLLAETEAIKREWSKWQELSQLIGSADGTKFSRFAQGLTLANLVALANKHLRQLNKRYKIRKCKDSDLELEIMDMYQADAVRPMRSLSGGETFIVSLALALGLSDLAGNKTRIESLFIDEGFGSLDADTLDTALNAMENLQASGKLIGIISHVELLKERISTQIIVEKMSGGVSRIAIRN